MPDPQLELDLSYEAPLTAQTAAGQVAAAIISCILAHEIKPDNADAKTFAWHHLVDTLEKAFTR